MKIQSIKTVYFSATGNTKNVVKLIGETIARNMNLSYKEIDFTLPQAHKDSYEFTKEELVIFGTPVYAGRVPNKVLPMIQGLFQGNDAFAVPVVTFGNRNYDNALIELRNELENNHFHTIAAGAFVAQHAFTDQLATMRPDKSDQEEIRGFAKRIVMIVEMIQTLGEIPKPVHVKGIEPIPPLANIYLHYVLDNWFDVIVKRQCSGECYLIRYADDFVCCFQNGYEAKVFREKLEERFAKYGLELAEEKTKVLEFGRFARQNRERRGQGKPETFDFLGFTFYCGMDGKKQFFRCRVKTSKKKLRSKIKAMKEWIMNHRTLPLEWIFKTINAKLRGHYQYYAVTDNTREIKAFQCITKKLLFKWLNRRGQRRSYTWKTFNDGLLRTFPLLEPSIKVSLFYR